MTRAAPSSRHLSLPAVVLTSLLSAIFVFALVAVARPGDVLGATTYKVTICSANLRTSASTSASIRTVLPAGTKVSVAASVTGGAWRTTCAGTTVSGQTWYRISAVNGKSVKSLYGVTYLYAVSTLFKTAPVTRYAACGTNLRTSPLMSATVRTSIPINTKVLVAATVPGTAWSRICGGRSVAGSGWYRISMVNGKTVKSLYGVSYLYAPWGFFKSSLTSTPTPTPTPTPGSAVRVTSIPALLSALADNSVTDVVVANGTYRVSGASGKESNSLWIGSRFAARTRPVTVRAETRGGVTFEGGGASYFIGLAFEEGAHDQTWDGFNFANGKPTQTGVVVFGGYAGLAAPHHITLRHIRFLNTLTWAGTNGDHTIYFSHAVGGPHDLLLEDITVESSALSSALHFYHSDSTNRNAWNVTVRRLTVSGTEQAIMLWDGTLRNIRIEDTTITNARAHAVRHAIGGTGIALVRIRSTGSGGAGFYSSLGNPPPGVTFTDSSFR